MTRRPLLLVMTFLLLLSTPLASRAQMQSAAPMQSGVTLLSSSDDGILLELDTPSYQIVDQNQEGRIYQRVEVPQADSISDPGKLELPMFSTLLGVPAGVAVSVGVVADDQLSLNKVLNLPVTPLPALNQEDLQPGQSDSSHAPAIEDLNVLPLVGPYPSTVARIASEAWMRDQRIVRVEIYPFQYDASQASLTWHQHLRLKVSFTPPNGGQVSNSIQAEKNTLESGDRFFEPLLKTSLLNYAVARGWRTTPASPGKQLSTYAVQPPTAGTPRYRIGVDQDGIYRLTYEALQAAGMPVDSVNPATFHLTSQGEDVAYSIDDKDGIPNKFSAGEAVVFYGQKFNGAQMAQRYAGESANWATFGSQTITGDYINWKPQLNATMLEKYTDENVYWLTEGGASGPTIASLNAAPGSGQVPVSYRATVHAEQSHFWKTTLFSGEETWFWDRISTISSESRTYTITLPFPAATAGNATITGEIAANTYNDSSSPDHHIQVYFNNPAHTQAVLDATWDGRSRYRFTGQVPQAKLVSGENALNLVVSVTPGMASDDLYFDWFDVTYDSQFKAVNNQIVFSGNQAGPWKFQVSGFSSSNIWALDITNPLLPAKMGNGVFDNNGTFAFQPSDSGGKKFIAAVPQDVKPEKVSRYVPPDFSGPVDYVLIAPQPFLAQTQILADYRTSQGMSTKVVDVADLYNSFNDGIYNPIAIKNYLAYAFAHWQTPPSFVLLVGDGHWNFKSYPEYDSPPIYMPPNLVWVDPWQGEVDSANLLANVVGSDPLPDVFIGRLPVNNIQELAAAIDKTKAYEQVPAQDWQRHYLYIADNTPDPAGDFVSFSNNIISDYITSNFNADQIYLNTFYNDGTCTSHAAGGCPAARDTIVNDLNNTGAALVNFIGHAANNYWTDEKIFANSDIQSLTNGSHLPVILSLTCLDGYWIHPNLTVGSKSGPGLAEELVRASGKGAVATFSPTGLGVSSGHDILQRGFYDSMFKDGDWQLGQAAQAGKLALFASGSNYDLISTFTIFGDPALQIQNPYRVNLTPGSQLKASLPGTSVTYNLLILNTGTAADTFGISITGSNWAVTPPTTTGLLQPGASYTLQLTMNIPAGATLYSQDVAEVSVISDGDQARQAKVVLTTIAGQYRVFVPVISK